MFPNGYFILCDFNNNNIEPTDAEPVKVWTDLKENFCTHLKATTTYLIQQKNKQGIAVNSNGKIFIKLDDATEETNTWTQDTINAFLQENNMTVCYRLAEPIYLDCTEEQIAVLEEIKNTTKSYNGTTHIFSTDEISPIFEVEAIKDMQLENDNLQTQIDEIKTLLSTTATSAMLLDNMQTDLESEV